jgi:hypothetical protein
MVPNVDSMLLLVVVELVVVVVQVVVMVVVVVVVRGGLSGGYSHIELWVVLAIELALL